MFPGANTSLPCPLECPCYKNKAPDDCFSYTELGYQLPCSRIDSNTTLKRSQNETSAAGGKLKTYKRVTKQDRLHHVKLAANCSTYYKS